MCRTFFQCLAADEIAGVNIPYSFDGFAIDPKIYRKMGPRNADRLVQVYFKAEQLFNRMEKKNFFTYSIMMNGKKIYSILVYHSLICLFPLRFSFKQTRTKSY